MLPDSQRPDDNILLLGITGTWEGWVPTATDLYLRGNNPGGWVRSSYAEFLSGGILLDLTGNKDSGSIKTDTIYNLAPYNYLNIEYFLVHGYMDRPISMLANLTCYKTSSSYEFVANVRKYCPQNTSTVLSIDISTVQYTAVSMIIELRGFSNNDGSTGYTTKGYIYRIWLSY